MLVGAIDVHLVNSTWDWVVTGLIAVLGALIGGGAALGASWLERRANSKQTKLDMLSRASGPLLDAFVRRERALVQALRDAGDEFTNRVHDPRAVFRLRDLELAVTEDIYAALPFVADKQLAERFLMARDLTIACRELVETASPDLAAKVDRAIVEVTWFFIWLRWNLENAQKGLDLPAGSSLPDPQRGAAEPGWPKPAGLEVRKQLGL